MMVAFLNIYRLRDRCDPFGGCCWPDLETPVTVQEVLDRVDSDLLYEPTTVGLSPQCRNREEHLQRIAWFVVYGWSHPIQVDVGIPSMACHVNWVIIDGNHRFAAAIIRGDGWIRAGVSGSMDEIEGLMYE